MSASQQLSDGSVDSVDPAVVAHLGDGSDLFPNAQTGQDFVTAVTNPELPPPVQPEPC